MKDEFSIWLENHKDHYALIDKSYKKVYMKEKKAQYDGNTNFELATYGDATLKLALCEILMEDKESKLTEKKKEYESDKVLVNIIAEHYKILDYLQFDKEDKNIPKDYNYESKKGRNPHKYIATAVEACLGAIFIEDKDIEKICEIVRYWIKLIDEKI